MNKKYFSIVLIYCLIICVFFQACKTQRNLLYFSNLPDSAVYHEIIKNEIKPTIQPGDALAIKVTTLNPDANILFNSGSLPMNNQSTGVSSGVSTTAVLPDGYIVDDDGNIEFPILGTLNLKGLTKEKAQAFIASKVEKTAKDPIVNIRILNFKVTVIGEVTKPGTFNVPNNKINVLEALGLAGDMTPYAIRNNVMLIREQNGTRTVQHINFNDKNILNSPYFNLKQNDILYVQPENKLKAQQANSGDFRFWSIIVSGLSVLSLIVYRFTN